MKLLSIGKFIEKTEYKENMQDFKTWTEMSQYFEEIYLIVESPDREWHQQKYGKLYIIWIPGRTKPYEFFYFMFQSLKCSLRLVKENNIDVLNVGEPICAGLMAVQLKKMVGKPLIVQLQGQLFNLPKSYSLPKRKLIKAITKFVCKKADRIRAVSQEIRSMAIKNGIDEKKIFVSPSRCDTEIFNVDKYRDEIDTIKKGFGYSEADYVLVFAGRLIPAKDVESILKAVKILIKEEKTIRLLIIGGGELQDKLKILCHSLGLDNVVTFYGNASFDMVPKLLSIGDIFVSPSLDEGMPRSVLEAMSMGMAVIVTPVGGNSEIIEDGVNGMLVEIKSPQQIADKISKLIKNPDLMQRIRKNARSKVVEKYEFKKCIKSFAEMHYIENRCQDD